MTLQNHQWRTFGGDPVTGMTPPRLIVYADTPGLTMNGEQEGFVAHVYKLFCDAINVSPHRDGYHLQNREAPDGTRVRMESIAGIHKVMVWVQGRSDRKQAQIYFLVWGPWVDVARLYNAVKKEITTRTLTFLRPLQEFERTIYAAMYDWEQNPPKQILARREPSTNVSLILYEGSELFATKIGSNLSSPAEDFVKVWSEPLFVGVSADFSMMGRLGLGVSYRDKFDRPYIHHPPNPEIVVVNDLRVAYTPVNPVPSWAASNIIVHQVTVNIVSQIDRVVLVGSNAAAETLDQKTDSISYTMVQTNAPSISLLHPTEVVYSTPVGGVFGDITGVLGPQHSTPSLTSPELALSSGAVISNERIIDGFRNSQELNIASFQAPFDLLICRLWERFDDRSLADEDPQNYVDVRLQSEYIRCSASIVNRTTSSNANYSLEGHPGASIFSYTAHDAEWSISENRQNWDVEAEMRLVLPWKTFRLAAFEATGSICTPQESRRSVEESSLGGPPSPSDGVRTNRIFDDGYLENLQALYEYPLAVDHLTKSYVLLRKRLVEQTQSDYDWVTTTDPGSGFVFSSVVTGDRVTTISLILELEWHYAGKTKQYILHQEDRQTSFDSTGPTRLRLLPYPHPEYIRGLQRVVTCGQTTKPEKNVAPANNYINDSSEYRVAVGRVAGGKDAIMFRGVVSPLVIDGLLTNPLLFRRRTSTQSAAAFGGSSQPVLASPDRPFLNVPAQFSIEIVNDDIHVWSSQIPEVTGARPSETLRTADVWAINL